MTTKKAQEQNSTALVPITADNLNKLASPQFRTNLNKMFKAELNMNKCAWQFALAVYNIVHNEYYKEDCGTLDVFANRVNKDKSVITKCVKGTECIVDRLGKYSIDMTNCDYTRAYALSTLKDNLDEFIHSVGVEKVINSNMRELEKMLKEFKDMKKGIVEVEPKNEEVKTSTQNEQSEELPTFTGRYDDNEVWFTIGKTKYVIPMSELKHYKVK